MKDMNRRLIVMAATAAPLVGLIGVHSARAAGYQPKNTVGYREQPNGKAACENCKLFVPNKADPAAGGCSVVAGTILPKAWCVIYEVAPVA